MATHLAGLFPGMPGWSRRLAGLGAHGVDLFFVASAVTLMLSWHARRGTDRSLAFSFYVRRLFRIAPMFWLALVTYSALHPLWPQFWQSGLFTGRSQWLTATFLHGWSPDSINSVVPGGWTIAAEMSFYAAFPILAVVISSVSRAVALVICSMMVAAAANAWAAVSWSGTAHAELGSFLLWWLPNNLPAFAIGILAYQLLPYARQEHWALPLWGLCAALISYLIMAGKLPWASSWTHPVSRGTAMAACAMGLVLCLSANPTRLLVNPTMRHIGKVSYSAYLIHFLVVEAFRQVFGPIELSGLPAVLVYGLSLLLVAGITVGVSTITQRVIERRGVRWGEALITSMHRRKALL
jgi:peptidoglycan/LPS O-acetylase OafA/YrhL